MARHKAIRASHAGFVRGAHCSSRFAVVSDGSDEGGFFVRHEAAITYQWFQYNISVLSLAAPLFDCVLESYRGSASIASIT